MNTDLRGFVQKSAQLGERIDTLQRKTTNLAAPANGGSWQPIFDLYHIRDHMFIDLELPGVPQSLLDVEMKPGMIVVRGEKPGNPLEDKEDTIAARTFGKFRCRFALPEGLEISSLDRRLENGVLHLKLKLLPNSADGR